MRYLLGLLFLMVWLVIPTATHAYTSDDFVITVDTSITGSGSSADNQFTLPTVGSGFDAVVDWGDGATTSLSGTLGDVTHTYAAPGIYEIVVSRNTPNGFPRFRFGRTEDLYEISTIDGAKLLTVEQWGTSQWTSMRKAFALCSNLAITASDSPNLSNVNDVWRMFFEATSFNSDISGWDVSSVTNLAGMFNNATAFNQNISSWDVSSATSFEEMFAGSLFNQPIGNWDMSSAIDISGMFAQTPFNQDISTWNVSGVQLMNYVFETTPFNQNLSTWNVVNVTEMGRLFDETNLSSENYSAILVAWAQLLVQNNVTLGADSSLYLSSASTSRQYLIDTYNWVINDAGPYVAPLDNTFVTVWDTRLDTDTPNELQIYATGGSGYNFTIDWGDGSEETFTSDPGDYISHTYSTPGIKTVTITGTFPAFDASCYNGVAYDKLIDVAQWGDAGWEYLNFSNCIYLESFSATDSPNLSQMTSINMMFREATAFNGNINNWDVSNITSMWFLFNGASSFNQPLDNWDVSNVTQISRMFQGATAFNQPLNNWDVSSATDFGLMFTDSSFNQPLNNWDVSSADRLYGMFSGTPFNQDISSWNISNVVYLDEGQDGSEPGMFNNSDISVSNYTKIIAAWSLLPLQSNLYLNIVGATSLPTSYCSGVQSARDILTGTYNWSIIDGGAVPCKTATYTIEGSGTIAGDSFQYIVDGDGGTAVTVVPASGYRFTSWSDGSTANPRTDTNLTADIAVTAILESTDDSSNKSSGTRIGVRDESLMEKISTVPVIGSIATFVINVQNFLTYLTENEEELEELTPEERTKVIIALRDIIVFLLRFIPGV